jgi:hypothetical protein
VTTPLFADAVTDVRGALTSLTGRHPIRATYEVQRSVKTEGKLDNDAISGKVAFELQGGPDGFQMIFSHALLEQVERERQAELRNQKLKAPTVHALSGMSTLQASEALDFAPTLLRLIDGAKVVSDAAGTWQGKPVRAVVLRVVDRIDDDDKKRLKIPENRLTLWIGPDHVPLAAEHSTTAKISVLILKWEQKQRKSWHLARVADRLVSTRYEEHQAGSGMGQKGSETTVATLRIH